MTVNVSAEQTEVAVDTLRLERLARFVLAREGADEEAELSVALVDEDEMRRLNERYTGREGATDVLAFPMDEAEAEGESEEPEEPVLLGDVIICPALASQNAREYGTTPEKEISLLLVHGILHLVGFEHDGEAEAETMRARERELLEAFAGGPA